MEPANGSGFAYDVRRQDRHAVVSLFGELDMASAPDLEACLEQLHANDVRHVTVDLAGLDFCDSSGLTTFLRSRQEAERRGTHLVLRSPQPRLRRLLELTNTEELLIGDGRPAPESAT